VEAERRAEAAEEAAAAEAAEATQLRERVRVLLSETTAAHQQLQTEAREHRAAADQWAAELLQVKREAAEAAAIASQENADKQRATSAALYARTEQAEAVRSPLSPVSLARRRRAAQLHISTASAELGACQHEPHRAYATAHRRTAVSAAHCDGAFGWSPVSYRSTAYTRTS
jgi:hypothetical protein